MIEKIGNEIKKYKWKYLLWFLTEGPWGKKISDELFLKIRYRVIFDKSLNLDHPKTFNEKLQWLKIHDRNPNYTKMVDKCAVKKYVADIIGSEYIIPTLGVWKKFEEIDFESLPNQFVLKCTHDSGGLVICSDKSKFDYDNARRLIESCLDENFYYTGREWPYKNVMPQIIVEEYIANDLQDYKLFCFNGKPRLTLVCSERFSIEGLKEDFFDEEWNHLDIKRPAHENSFFPIKKPKCYAIMKELASKLVANIAFSRVDFYEINGKVYFGEITFYPASGFEGFIPEEWDLKLGEWVELLEGGTQTRK